ncbi:MAG: 2TM domain-containing protein [Marinicella sp.]
MIIKKLRLQNSWSQEQLAHFSGLSIRTIQRAERGKPVSLESLKALAAVFEINVNDIKQEPIMNQETHIKTTTKNVYITDEEAEAIEFVKGLKDFYQHLFTYIVIIPFLGFVNWFTSPGYYWVLWVVAGWGVGLLLHAIWAFDLSHKFDAEWEKKQVEKRLGRKL